MLFGLSYQYILEVMLPACISVRDKGSVLLCKPSKIENLHLLLRAEPGTGRVGSGSDRDPARGTDLASAGRSAAPTRPSRPVFQQPEDRMDIGGCRDRTVSEDGDGARVWQHRRYFITKLILYGTVVGLLY